MAKELGTLFGIAASGKDTVLRSMSENPHLKRIVNDTTRAPRDGEIDGLDYHFISDEEHEIIKKNNRYLTFTEEKGRHYGVRKSEITIAWKQNKIPVGHFGLKDHLNLWQQSDAGNFDCKSIFLSVPSHEIWVSRMENRVNTGFITEQEMQLRGEEAAKEYSFLANNIGRFAVILSNEGRSSKTTEDCINYYLYGKKPEIDHNYIEHIIHSFDVYGSKDE